MGRPQPAGGQTRTMTIAGAPSAWPIAALDSAGRRFGDVIAVDGVTLNVRPGSLLGVIGPSGAGKTTAVRLLNGSLRPTSGSARVFGRDPTALPAGARRRLGSMPQQVSLYDDLTVSENLDFVASLFGMHLFSRRRRIREMLDWLKLADVRSRRASALSGGMQRRVQLGCALVHRPDLVFLDEPTAGIDPLLRQTIWRELRSLRDGGTAMVVTTQYLPEAEECDEVALIASGRLVALAAPEALRQLAFGGELLDVETEGLVDARAIATDPIIHAVRQLGPRALVVTVSDAASATPTVLASIEAAGGAVTSIEVLRPSFDEVFARLVERMTDPSGSDSTEHAA